MSIRINGIDRPSTLHQTSTSPHGTYHLADNPNLYEIQRSNHFDFIVTGIDGIVRAGMSATDYNGRIPNAQEILRLSVSGAPVPHYSQGAITVQRGNSTIKYAGTPSFSAGTVTVIDYIGADTKAVLQAWQNQSYDVRTEKVGLVQDYKKDCYLIEYSPDMQVVRKWLLHGCWISELREDDYSSDGGNDKRRITATIEYDRGEIDTSDSI